jgi:hypothetical protein
MMMSTAHERTVLGMGVPVASSHLDPNEEETRQYVPEEMPGVSLPALLARCAQPSEADALPRPPVSPVVSSSGIRPRDASFHTVPNFPEDSSPSIELKAESNLHQLDADRITDALARDASSNVVHLRIGVSSRPPEVAPASSLPPPRPRRLAKVLFTGVACGVALLMVTEVSIVTHKPWLDPRVQVARGIKVAKEKIPWDRIPKLHRP